MPYSQYTLSEVVQQISDLMDDPTATYWTVAEIQDAVYEALRVWGALTNYWRTRGTFPVAPSDSSPYYDLSALLPTLRPRTTTLTQVVIDIQRCLLEPASGISGTGMTGQITIESILNAVQATRNRFVLDAHLPIASHTTLGLIPPDGMVTFDQSSVFVHRASWQDDASSIWTNLWRQDAWAVDKNNPNWTLEPGSPQQYSEAENSPLQLQLSPPPSRVGVVDVLSVDSLKIDLTDPDALLGIPDEWVHAIKYGSLAYLLYGEGQIKDIVRAQYAEMRYQQAVEFAKDARSVMRLLLGNVPLNIDSLYNMDAGSPFWRNTPAVPSVAGCLYDIVVLGPVTSPFGIGVDLVQSAPLPQLADYMPLGIEELDHVIDYASHILTFKCGGDNLKSTYPTYDGVMQAVAGRKGVNAAKIQYLTPLLGQPQKEWQQRPDRVKV